MSSKLTLFTYHFTAIYYFKNILSIKDIETLLKPITDKAFSDGETLDMTELYEAICAMEKAQINPLQEEIRAAFEKAEESFPDAAEDDRSYLHLFSFICSLSFDVYVKKLLIEKIIDELPRSEGKQPKK